MQEMQETQVQSLGWEESLGGGNGNHSRILARKIPWKRSLAGYSLWGPKESDTTEHTHRHMHMPSCSLGTFILLGGL